MVPVIRLAIDDVAVEIRLWPNLAPKTVAALLGSLPVDTTMRHCKWSGDACFAELDSGPIMSITKLESAVTSIYPGTLVIRPKNTVVPTAELLLSYGDAEYRWPTDRMSVTPVGDAQGDTTSLFAVMAKMATAGHTRVRVTRSEAAAL